MKTRRKFISQSIQVSAGSLLIPHLLSAKYSLDNFKMTPLRGDVGYFTERGGTIGWLANKQGIVVVDTQFPDQAKNLYESLQKMQEKPIDLVINTHHHGDHSAGNSFLVDVSKRILAHKNSKANQKRSAEARGNETTLPDDVFSDRRTEKVAGEVIEMYYYGAAHTDGDAITHFTSANIVHMGDLIFNRRFPYIDKSAGAMISNWIQVLDKTVNTFDNETLYIFGHSDNGYDVTGTADDIREFQNYLEKLMEFGIEAIAAGRTLDEVKADTMEIPGAPQWKGNGISRSLDAVYAELNP